MKRAIILHGMPEKEEWLQFPLSAERQWLPWLRGQLQSRGIEAVTPELPLPYRPVYEAWKEVFEKFTVDEDTDLIGHSCGAGFLVRWLSENPVKVGRVALVAPWMDPDRWLDTGMFDFQIDKGFASRTKSTEVFVSSDDDSDILASVDKLRGLKGIHFSEFTDKGHFVLDSMKTEEFPELLDYLTKA